VAIPRTRNFGLLILGPILVNILAFHVFITKGAGLFDPMLLGIVVLARSGIGGASGVLAESCGSLPDLGAAANAPRLGAVASGVPVEVVRSPLASQTQAPIVALRSPCAPWLRVLVPEFES
jgi:hypothetical protein